MFSIIIPLYNKAKYIEKAILSVLNQSCQEFELIIVNDGSTDGGLEIVNQLFLAHNLTRNNIACTALSQLNQGVSTTRNNGVKNAKYEYIAFLDADDWWESTYLEEMKYLILEFPQAGIYGSSYYKVKNKKLIAAQIGVDPYFDRGLIDYLATYIKSLYMPLWTGTTIIKKSVFEFENGFKPHLKMGEDFDLWIRIAVKHPVAFINKPLGYYNQDVDLANRAVGDKLYRPIEHMLFTDYGELFLSSSFCQLYEILALYGLLPYYLTGTNKKEVECILSKIQWKNHAFKYRLYYRILPKFIIRLWIKFQKIGSLIKINARKLLASYSFKLVQLTKIK